MTRSIQGTSRKCLYQDLGLKSVRKIVLLIIMLKLQIKAILRSFLTEQKSSSTLSSLFVLGNGTIWENPCAKLNLSSNSNQC